jgi:hypothetical protein
MPWHYDWSLEIFCSQRLRDPPEHRTISNAIMNLHLDARALKCAEPVRCLLATITLH